ncbi:hypothetical protein ACFSCW_14715 [Sphingomonas tabacisoli]|uniref:Lipoprotein n=1 Tax=Sphingomonas tabacisoli TaxID=2249466 RepID=A0ABW4I7C6_9SPHN
MRAWMMLPLLLAGCGQKQAALPDDPIQRAATCGVIAAAQARQARGVDAKLTIEQQGHILHYALLAGGEGGSFDRTRSAAVVNAMPQLGDKVTSGKWEPLIGQCASAYPATRPVDSVTLPSDPLTAEAGCHDLADFVTTALRTQENNFIDKMRAYDEVQRKLDQKMGATLKARGLNQAKANEARAKAFASIVTLGPPTTVLDQCVKKFGS